MYARTQSHQRKNQDGALPTLNVTIEALDLANEIVSITLTKTVFGSVNAILVMIKVRALLVHFGSCIELLSRIQR